MTHVIRLAQLSDIPRLSEIERSAAKAFRNTPHAWIEHDNVIEAEAYPPLIAAQNVRVIEFDGTLAGAIVTQIANAELHILELSVHEEFQRKGLGRALVQSVLALAKQEGCSAATLTTFADVPFNAPFYESLGFQKLADPNPRLAAILQAEALHGLLNRCAMRAPL